ncbi:undecaprenyl-phosphate 4-deoxy-4-formamido-L-arabinose transferase [archaeon BMS3Abin16]|nr:undecaprenyl-phosphate 4-deoxy-4-formamido-L-arabinose transferase [archaeon BMS3Abin16]HDY74683.1 glycosyltransferase family 2 protein [Euryarchaeota archaeon]
MDLSIVVPAFNEETSIADVLKEVLNLSFEGLEWEVVVVDDGSSDRTAEILHGFLDVKRLKIVTHEKNRGKGAALRSGIDGSSGGIVAFQDSDSEYDPGQLPALVREIQRGTDVVYGSRFLGQAQDMTFLFNFGNRFLSLCTSLIYRAQVSDMETGFKVFRRRVLDGLELKSLGFDIEPEITAKILKKGIKIKEVPIDYRARAKTHKKITLGDGVKALYTLIKYRF